MNCKKQENEKNKFSYIITISRYDLDKSINLIDLYSYLNRNDSEWF